MKSEIVFKNDNLIIDNNNENRKLNIIHFNDVYNIECRNVEPIGGASRFKKAVDILINKSINDNIPYLVLFSGDAFNPSTLSILKGRPMVKVLNKLNINCACIGNHDFG